MPKQKMGYIIRLDNSMDYEYNVDDEILVFETLDQIEQYAKINRLNLDNINIYEVELEDWQ